MARRTDKEAADDGGPITRDQLRAQFRELSGDADEIATEFRSKALAAGAVAAALLILVVFLVGRSRGRKATTVVEIVRV